MSRTLAALLFLLPTVAQAHPRGPIPPPPFPVPGHRPHVPGPHVRGPHVPVPFVPAPHPGYYGPRHHVPGIPVPGVGVLPYHQHGFRIHVAPPAPRVEVRPYMPSPRHHWAPGHWQWNGHSHVWIGGSWMLPPTAGVTWIAARWVNAGGQWVYEPGHWSNQPVAQPVYAQPVAQPVYAPQPGVVYAPVAPPAPQVEGVPPEDPNNAWIPGHWQWTGSGYSWAAGHWEPRRHGHVWQPTQWVQEGAQWRMVPGGWRRY